MQTLSFKSKLNITLRPNVVPGSFVCNTVWPSEVERQRFFSNSVSLSWKSLKEHDFFRIYIYMLLCRINTKARNIIKTQL